MEVAAELEALGAAFLEVPAGGSADVVDLAGVGAVRGAEVHAAAVRVGGKGCLPKVAGLDGLGDVFPAGLPPPQEVLFGDENAAVVAGPAAGTAGKAVKARLGWVC